MARYNFTIKGASDVWNVVHGLGKYVSTDVFVFRNGDLTKILPKSVEYVSDDEIKITFSNPESGKATVCS